MSNQNLYCNILNAYEKYVEDKRIEEFQGVLESSLNALEGLEQSNMSQLKEIMNEIEYARFLYSGNDQPAKVKEAVAKLKQILEI